MKTPILFIIYSDWLLIITRNLFGYFSSVSFVDSLCTVVDSDQYVMYHILYYMLKYLNMEKA